MSLGRARRHGLVDEDYDRPNTRSRRVWRVCVCYKRTMLPSIEDSLCIGKVRLVGGADDNKLDVGIGEDIVDGAVYFWRNTKALLYLTALGRRIALENCIEGEEIREGQDEGDVECKACKANAEDADFDGCHDVELLTSPRP